MTLKNTAFRIPGFLRDNPVESVLAAALLAVLLFMAGDGTGSRAGHGPSVVAAEKK